MQALTAREAVGLDPARQVADQEQDEATRNDKFHKAEQLLLHNAVYIPLGYWVQMYVQDPKLQGTRQGPWTGRLPVLFDKSVVLTK